METPENSFNFQFSFLPLLHLCVENNLDDAVEFLIFKGANLHIMDIFGEDACDKAKKNGMAMRIHKFNDCNA